MAKSLWYRNGALRVSSSGNPVYGDGPDCCCPKLSCTIIPDSTPATANQTTQQSSGFINCTPDNGFGMCITPGQGYKGYQVDCIPSHSNYHLGRRTFPSQGFAWGAIYTAYDPFCDGTPTSLGQQSWVDLYNDGGTWRVKVKFWTQNGEMIADSTTVYVLVDTEGYLNGYALMSCTSGCGVQTGGTCSDLSTFIVAFDGCGCPIPAITSATATCSQGNQPGQQCYYQWGAIEDDDGDVGANSFGFYFDRGIIGGIQYYASLTMSCGDFGWNCSYSFNSMDTGIVTDWFTTSTASYAEIPVIDGVPTGTFDIQFYQSKPDQGSYCRATFVLG